MSSRRAATVPDRSGRASGIVVEACLQTVSKTEAHPRVVSRTGEEIEPAVNALFCDELACVVAWLRMFSGFGFDSHALPPSTLAKLLLLGCFSCARLQAVSRVCDRRVEQPHRRLACRRRQVHVPLRRAQVLVPGELLDGLRRCPAHRQRSCLKPAYASAAIQEGLRQRRSRLGQERARQRRPSYGESTRRSTHGRTMPPDPAD
jgi:hypothetical protein